MHSTCCCKCVHMLALDSLRVHGCILIVSIIEHMNLVEQHERVYYTILR